MNQHITIAIDGPAGAGKSTIARGIAKKLGILYLDTGAMYRAVGLKVLRKGFNFSEEARITAMLDETDLDIRYRNGQQRVFLDGEDVTDVIRSPEVAEAASAVAVLGEVRVRLVDIQRGIARGTSVIMDGRDIGTNVLVDAKYKFYLTASVAVRARRRYTEWKELGETNMPAIEDIEHQIEQRDAQDMNRVHSPLKVAADAVLIDTSDMTIKDVMNAILERL